MLTATMDNETPARAGWRIVLENPKLFLIELVWRWSFGALALLLAIQACAIVLQRITVSDATWTALHSQDLTSVANAMAELILAFWKVFCLVLAALLLATAVVWFLAASWGRAATLRVLKRSGALRVVAGSNLLRILLVMLTALATVLVIAGAALFSARFSVNPNEPNLVLYLLIVMVALPIIALVWAALNWVLSLAPLFSVRGKKQVFASLAAALRNLRANRKAYWSVSGVYGTVRCIALTAIIVLGIILGALGENWIVLSLVVALVLLYFAFADLLYIGRLAAYLEIVERSSTTGIKTSPTADAAAS